MHGRITKKLNLDLLNQDIKTLITKILLETNASDFNQKGKNIYITNNEI